VWKVSKSLDLKDVAAMGVSYGTAWVSLTRRANVQAGCVRNSTLGHKGHRTRVQKGSENSVVSPNLYLETDNPRLKADPAVAANCMLATCDSLLHQKLLCTHVKINKMCSQQACSKLVNKLPQGCHSQLIDKLLNCRTITSLLSSSSANTSC
jgi:hypothetical protein